MSFRFSAIVLPVTVKQSPCNRPASSKALRITGIPPTLSTSVITYFPNGFKSPSNGSFEPTLWKSSSVKSTSASWAIANK
ncbi:unannotated protein [freshwater metagenome]|uniref:Unannotated protein n=1 Tax=freshwater metagenome TaxID=449393 RepID=A0A6J6BV18_9ZZZZ